MVLAAANGMKTVAEGTYAEEVYSAYLTMARNAVQLAKESGRENSDIRMALQSMLELLDGPPEKVH